MNNQCEIYIYVLALNITSPITLGMKSKSLIEISFNVSTLNVYDKESPWPLTYVHTEHFFQQFKFTNIVNELYDHLIQDMAIISISGNRWTHITLEKLIKYRFPYKYLSRRYMMHKCNGNSFSNTFEDFYYIADFFSLSVVYRINSKLIFSYQKNIIKIWSNL
jgi:hypothetical protein